MKTKLTLLLAIFALTTFSLNAQTPAETTGVNPVSVKVQDARVEITVDQLPEAVHKTLKVETYKDWTVSKAYHVKNEAEDGTSAEHYELVMRSNDRETTLRLDKNGNVIE